MRGVLHRDAGARRQRLRNLGKRGSDDVLQEQTDVEVEQPWQLTAQGRELWFRLETPFVTRMLRKHQVATGT